MRRKRAERKTAHEVTAGIERTWQSRVLP